MNYYKIRNTILKTTFKTGIVTCKNQTDLLRAILKQNKTTLGLLDSVQDFMFSSIVITPVEGGFDFGQPDKCEYTYDCTLGWVDPKTNESYPF